jgi:SAM-dependent methyltransferase
MRALAQNRVDYVLHREAHEVKHRVALMGDRLAKLKPQPGSSALEVGLGSGLTTKMLVQWFSRVTCVDLEPQRIEEVRDFIRPATAQFICDDGVSVPLSSAGFDHAFLIGLLEHCPKPDYMLKNVARALKDGGRISVLVNNANSIHRHLGVAMGIHEHVGEISDADVNFGHYRVYTPESITETVESAGFDVDHIDAHYLKPLPTRQMRALPAQTLDAFAALGRKFPQLAAYTYLEAVKR